MNSDIQSPTLIEGGCHVDARGTVSFFNSFTMKGVDRFYWVKAAQNELPRGWVGHRRDEKWFSVTHGEVLVAVVQPDDWQSPSRNLPVARYHLKAIKPQILHVPPGCATGSLNFTPDSVLLVLSSGKIEDAASDNFRFPVDWWPIRA